LPATDLSILIFGLERTPDPDAVRDGVQREAASLDATVEVVTVAAAPDGFGAALRRALAAAQGTFVLMLDADLAPPYSVVGDLWSHRHNADLVVASRYAEGAAPEMPAWRTAGSGTLNAVFRRVLSLGVRDVSSSFRIFRAAAVAPLPLLANDYDILEEMLVRTCAAGWRIGEIPFAYKPRRDARRRTHRELTSAYLRTTWAMWALRNSIAAADYDFRAHDSVIPLQRFWQRSRHRYITELTAGQGPVLDVGCGSSRIIGSLAPGSVAVDVLMNKLRFARRFQVPLAQASGFALPFADESFPCVLCSQVIEHVPMVPSMIDELCRVLRPGGRLVLGTPDYDRWEWVYMEKAYGFFAPGGYADEHISHYTRAGLLDLFARKGYTLEAPRRM
jgi:dolichol-phosphate mannosyltransferase